jgi:hypothetical protein
MYRPFIRAGGVAVLVAALAALLGVAATAGAKPHHRCSRSAGPRVPTVTNPCNGGTVHVGKNPTFRAHDGNSKAHRFHPFIEITKKKPNKAGVLPTNPGADGVFDEMHSVRGHSAQFTDRPHPFNFPGYWLVTPGKYYVQVQQVDARAPRRGRQTGLYFSPVQTFFVR